MDLQPKHSEKLEAWFNTKGDAPGFWDFFLPGLPDYEVDHTNEENWDLFDRGIAFGRKAGKKSVLVYATDCVTLYFIGSERDVLKKLNAAHRDWIKKNPPGKETMKRLQLERELKSLQAERSVYDSRISNLSKQLKAL